MSLQTDSPTGAVTRRAAAAAAAAAAMASTAPSLAVQLSEVPARPANSGCCDPSGQRRSPSNPSEAPSSVAPSASNTRPEAQTGPSRKTAPKRRAHSENATDDEPGNQSRAVKQRVEPSASSTEAASLCATKKSLPGMSLFVRWYSPTGKTKVNHLILKPIEGVESLEGISKDLVARAFPESDRPDYITSDDFYKFTPVEEFMSLPGDIARTEFRLVATYDGYEYTVLERELGAHRDPERKMLVTVIEFESTALMIGHLGVRVSLIAYPVVSIKKNFLDDIEQQLKSDSEFKGIL